MTPVDPQILRLVMSLAGHPSPTGLPVSTDLNQPPQAPAPAPQVAAQPQPPSLPIPPQYQRADQLEAQAAPPADPTEGMSPMKAALYKGIQGFGQGLAYSHTPGGYAGHVQLQQQNERQRQQDLLTRAKELRGEGLQQSQLYQRGIEQQQEQDYRNATLEETRRLRTTQEAAQERLGRQPIPVTQGTTLFDPISQKPLYNNPKQLTGSEKGLQHVAGRINGKDAFAVFNPNPEPGEGRFTDPATGQDISGSFQPMPAPGQFLVGPTGEVQAVGDPRNRTITPIAGGGVRRAPVPAGEMDKQRDLDNSVRKIDELGTLFQEGFVGPATGRYLKVKAMLPESIASLPPGYTDFMALQSDLKNSVIKLITGAQMGQQEASRILQQVPVETDRPDMWLSKYKQTQANAQNLLRIINQQTGLPTQQPAPTAPATGGWKIKSVR